MSPRPLAPIFAGLLAVGLLAAARADDPKPPKPDPDDALSRLLEQAGERDKAKDQDKAVPKGQVAPKDDAVDKLLEKLGATEDRPEAAGRPAKPDPDAPKPDKPDQPQGPGLDDRDKPTDEHLEKLLGRIKKKDGEQEEQGGAGGAESGPLGETIRKMREVEQRLGKTDTGDETREKQQEIVKGLDKFIEQARRMQGQQGKGRRMTAQGQQPGDQPGNQPGAQGRQPGEGGAPPMNPDDPDARRALAGAKDEWGHLPPDLKGELMNVAGELPLAKRKELIARYYLSIAKKNLAREK